MVYPSIYVTIVCDVFKFCVWKSGKETADERLDTGHRGRWLEIVTD